MKKGVCQYGHPMRTPPGGRSYCPVCHAARNRERWRSGKDWRCDPPEFCSRGHRLQEQDALTGRWIPTDDLYRYPTGRWACRQCHREWRSNRHGSV